MDDCRFPVGEDGGGHLFCGDAAPGKSSYCPHHHGIAYVRRPIRRAVMAAFLAKAAEGYAPTPTVPPSQRRDIAVDVWMEVSTDISETGDCDD